MKAQILAAATIPVLWNNWLLPRLELDRRGRTVANMVAATGYGFVFGGRPNWFSESGIRWGIGCAAVVAAGCTAALVIPPVRRILGDADDRAPEVGSVEWVAVHIPLGTVYAEEMIFRGTLDPLLDRAFGATTGAVAGAAVFGLWHIHPARAAGDNVWATVGFTGISGLFFGVLFRHTGSATAPALLHWAVNAGGAVLTRSRRVRSIGDHAGADRAR
ncbi:CPBP family intramembrane glutamic endopeptidase [Nocardia rhamnosiphila]|uniref:CPBP family intramembrane glutamic endopeptidase n=1 Tax=Nocardia rhamnosiphila TaxID=426716 RepID=UPI0004C3956F|nr:CPBP family intramembrane glutamic endopeptidase [Nocardia rhamnosiphila]